MGAFNELYRTFNNVAAIQEQIYNDACDSGFAYHTNNVPLDVKALFEEINDMKNYDGMIQDRTVSKDCVSMIIHVPIELDGNIERGYEYNVSYVKTNNHPSRIDKESNAFVCVTSSIYNKERK